MAQHEREETTDAGLERLLEVEKRLEAVLRAAEAAAQARVEEARAAALALSQEHDASIDATLQVEEASALEVHRGALAAVSAEALARIARLERLTAADLDRLAKKAVARVLGEKGAGPP